MKSGHVGLILISTVGAFIIGSSWMTARVSEFLLRSSSSAQSAEELVAKIDEFWFFCLNEFERANENGSSPKVTLHERQARDQAKHDFLSAAALEGISVSRVEELLKLSYELGGSGSREALRKIESLLMELRREEVSRHREAIGEWSEMAASLTKVLSAVQVSSVVLLAAALYFQIRYIEQERGVSEARIELGKLVESSQGSIFSTDRSGNIQKWNPASERMFGVPREQALGVNIASFLAESQESALRSRIHGEQPIALGPLECKMRGADGEPFYAALSFSPVIDRDGRCNSITIVARDVSEPVRLRHEQADFIASLTHDLKNPLIANNQILRLLLSGDLERERRDEFLNRVIISNQNIIDMFTSMLEVYKMNSGTFKVSLMDVRITRIIEDVIESHRHHAALQSVKLESRVADALPLCRTDPILLKKILNNLLDNAIKYSSQGCSAIVSVFQDESKLAVVVEDNGRGLPESKSLFSFSFSMVAEDKKSGPNFWLFLSPKLSPYPGAPLSYEKVEPQGTRFILRLPLAVADTEVGLITEADSGKEDCSMEIRTI